MRFTLKNAFLILLFLSFPVSAHTASADITDWTKMEKELIDLVNSERRIRNLAELQYSEKLTEVARAHSRRMKREQKMSHHFPGYPDMETRLIQKNLYFSTAGENVALTDLPDMQFVHHALMDSPKHRDNILSTRYRQIGIGIDADANHFFITQNFADLITPVSEQQMEEELIGLILEQHPRHIRIVKTDKALTLFCRKKSQDFLSGRFDKKIPDFWASGRVDIFTHSFVKITEVIPKIIDSLGTLESSCALGVKFGRSRFNPGGTYIVTVVRLMDTIRRRKSR